MEELLRFARELAGEAGRQLMERYGRSTAELKGDGTVVTEADRAADDYLCRQIRARYPDHGILSEEGSTRYDGDRFTWVIDPLDGSNNYALGVCYWGCSIALLCDGWPLLGVLLMPPLGAEFWAVRGGGAFLNGERLGGPLRPFSENNSFLGLCSRTWRYLDLAMPQKARILGSAAYDLAAVAQGVEVGCVQLASHVWDLAAGWLMVRESGRAVGPLLPGTPDPFPLAAGDEYGNRHFPLAAAADQAMLDRIRSRLSIKASARARLDGWAAAGWRR